VLLPENPENEEILKVIRGPSNISGIGTGKYI